MNNKICPKCKQTMLYIHSKLSDNDVSYVVECYWCNYISNEYKNITEAKQNYEDAIF